MSAFLRALAWVAPGAALARANALAVLGSRGYDGTARGRRARGLTGRGSSANEEIGKALAPLRDRSRDAARNTAIGQRVLDVLVSHIVGTGIGVRWNTGNKALDRRLAKLWSAWCKRADIEGVLDFNGLVALAVRSMLEGGDSVVRMLPRPATDPRPVKLALLVQEGDHIDEARPPRAGSRTILGVELGEHGERVGYWLRPHHPGELAGLAGLGGSGSELVGREFVCHLFRPLRAGQVRGVPVLAPVLMSARDHADLVDALVVKARMEACHGLIFKEAEGAPRTLAAAKRDETGVPLAEMRPGMQLTLPAGYDVTTLQPAGSGVFGELSVHVLQLIAAGVGITYDQLTGDLRQANYSSLRAGKIEFRRLVEQVQWLVVIPQLVDRVVELFIEQAITAGTIPRRADGYGREYVPPAVEPIDPRKDLEADILAVRAGRMSPQEFVEAWGRPWQEVVEESAAFFAEADRLGLVLDIDPRKTNQVGKTQDAAAAAPAADG